jgi:hypothetical protein
MRQRGHRSMLRKLPATSSDASPWADLTQPTLKHSTDWWTSQASCTTHTATVSNRGPLYYLSFLPGASQILVVGCHDRERCNGTVAGNTTLQTSGLPQLDVTADVRSTKDNASVWAEARGLQYERGCRHASCRRRGRRELVCLVCQACHTTYNMLLCSSLQAMALLPTGRYT